MFRIIKEMLIYLVIIGTMPLAFSIAIMVATFNILRFLFQDYPRMIFNMVYDIES